MGVVFDEVEATVEPPVSEPLETELAAPPEATPQQEKLQQLLSRLPKVLSCFFHNNMKNNTFFSHYIPSTSDSFNLRKTVCY